MKKLLFAVLSSAALYACGGPSETPIDTPPTVDENLQSETERLNEWFEVKFEEELAFSPIALTRLGRKEQYDQIDDFSDAGADEKLAWMLETTVDLKNNFEYDQLTDNGKISYDLWLYRVDRERRNASHRRQVYALHQHNGLQSFFPTFLINTHRVDSAEDFETYITRISGVARALDQLLVRAQLNAESGVRPPRFSYEGVIQQSTNIISGAPFDDGEPSALYKDMLSKIDGLTQSGAIDDARTEELASMAATALTDNLAPAYQRIIDWFEEDLPNSDESAQGAAALPSGESFYGHRLWVNTTTDLTAEEIHQIGLDEVARLRAEMEAIKNEVGFEGPLQDFFAFIREDDQFYFSNNDAGAQDYIDAAAAHIEALKPLLPEYFGILPKADLEVRRVEPFRERPGAAQHYRAGTPDGSRPGIYYAHLSDMRAMSIPSLEVIAYHEGLPGHHMQISIAQELEGIPTFRTQARFTAYSEGWGLYSEYLAKEMGAYEDPYSEFGRLTSEIWRAIRLVVDTGLHVQGWSEEEARQYFFDNSPIPEGAVISEVRRYLVNPGQATAYKIGMIKILELRAKAKAELGEAFDIRGFHDTVLGGGAVPMSILETQVDNWIAELQAG